LEIELRVLPKDRDQIIYASETGISLLETQKEMQILRITAGEPRLLIDAGKPRLMIESGHHNNLNTK